MRILWLLRHAKSSWADDSVPDHERPLNARGQEAARRLGRFLAGADALPDLVLCSSALRTRQTFEGLAAELAEPPPCQVERDLYLASAGDLLSRLQAVPEAIQSVMVIAHNPGIGELAQLLAASGDAGLRRELARKFPTGALAQLRLDAPAWAELSRGCELLDFVRPRLLPSVT